MGPNALNTANMTYVQQVQYILTTKAVQEDVIYIKVKKKQPVLNRIQRNVYLNVSHDLVIDFPTWLCMNMSLGDVRPEHQWKFHSLN